jgi:hypothetical protein
MTALLHLGFEHLSVLWLAGVGLLAFLAGLLVNLYRARREEPAVDGLTDRE